MINWIWEKYRKYIMYLIVGGCTTVVNMIIFIVMRQFNMSLIVANTAAFIGAVLFAYVTNRKWVFRKNEKQSIKEKLIECSSFFAMRLVSFFIETVLLLISVMMIDTEIINKIIISIIVILMNYIISNKIIFK